MHLALRGLQGTLYIKDAAPFTRSRVGARIGSIEWNEDERQRNVLPSLSPCLRQVSLPFHVSETEPP